MAAPTFPIMLAVALVLSAAAAVADDRSVELYFPHLSHTSLEWVRDSIRSGDGVPTRHFCSTEAEGALADFLDDLIANSPPATDGLSDLLGVVMRNARGQYAVFDGSGNFDVDGTERTVPSIANEVLWRLLTIEACNGKDDAHPTDAPLPDVGAIPLPPLHPILPPPTPGGTRNPKGTS